MPRRLETKTGGRISEQTSATAVYLRVSTIAQDFDSQRQEVLGYCKRRGWKNPRIYTDTASGLKSRPQLEAMCQDIWARHIKTVVVYKLDRLGRSLSHLAMLLDEWTKNGVTLIATSQGIDTAKDNPVGKLQLGVLLAVAEFERELIRERTVAGLHAAKARGRILGRPRKHEAVKAQIDILKKEGKGIRSIARELNLPTTTVHRLVHKVS